MNNPQKNQKGAVVIIVAVMLITLIAFLGLAVDSGYMFVKKNELQNVADAVALACLIEDRDAACGTTASPTAATTVTSNSDITPILTPVIPPGKIADYVVLATYPYTPCPSSASLCAQASASTHFTPFFMSAFGFSNIPISATAVAGNLGGPACLIAITTFTINGTDTAYTKNCSAAIGTQLIPKNKNFSGICIWDGTGAQGSNCSGTGTITVYKNDAGGSSSDCGACAPVPVIKSSALPTLPTYTVPTVSASVGPTCVTKNKITTCTYTPGSYPSLVNLTNTTIFTAGNYLFNGGLQTNNQTVTNVSTTSGAGITGVSFYIAANKPIDLSGNVTLNAPALTGCTSGSGVVISQPVGGLTPVTLNGNKNNLMLTGVVNLPSMDLTVDGAAAGLQINGTLIVDSIQLNGNIYPTLGSSPCYSTNLGSRISLVQ